MEAKEEIRSRLNIEDVIGEYVQLRRAGRNFKGLSPFSSEKTPSFMVSPDKHIWHDFSSNRGGDIFSFIMEVEGTDFRGAMEILARKANVDLSQYQQKGGDRALTQRKERLYKLLDLATTFYQQSMIKNSSAIEYIFKNRKLSKQVVSQFKIGYSPNADDGLLAFLLKRGYKQEDVRDAGLLATRRGRPGDMFRGRMMVPLADAQGRVVGFTARLIDVQPNAPKYINTPQTLLYDKGRQVFGLSLAKEAIRKNDYVVIVEGNLDVISSHQAGVAQVVATAGTAMTEYHLRSLSRLAGNIRLAFDQDAAGITATERAISIASKLGLQMQIVTVTDGFKDPDELIQHDPQAWLRVIEQPQDAVEWLLDQYVQRYDLATAQGKSQATTRALEVISQLTDPVAQEHYVEMLAKRTGASTAAIKAKLNKTEVAAVERTFKTSKAQRTATKDNNIDQDRFLAVALAYPTVRDVLKYIQFNDLEGSLRQEVYKIIANSSDMLDDKVIEGLQPDEFRVKIRELQLIAEQYYGQLAAPKEIAEELLKRVIKPIKNKQKSQLAKALAAETDPQKQQAINEELKKITLQIKMLK
ncbi:MAG: DNA primase [Candidatus Woesebacteria bacterium]|jgi:DNA primase